MGMGSQLLHLRTAAFCWSPGTVGPLCVLSRVVNTVSVDPDFKESQLFVNFESRTLLRSSQECHGSLASWHLPFS